MDTLWVYEAKHNRVRGGGAHLKFDAREEEDGDKLPEGNELRERVAVPHVRLCVATPIATVRVAARLRCVLRRLLRRRRDINPSTRDCIRDELED